MTLVEYNLKSVLEKEKLHIEELKKSLGENNGSKLYIRQRNGAYYFTKATNRKEIGITNKPEEIEKLLRYEKSAYDLELAENNLYLLSECLLKIEKRNGEVRTRQRKRCELLEEKTGIIIPIYSEADWNWMKSCGTTNSFHPENLKYLSVGGVKVRSKSELSIASRLENYSIPFVYEKEIFIGGRYIFPDFTIRKRDGSIVIWEHFGLMDDPEYAKWAMEKIELYRMAGFVQCKNLICTYEEDILSVSAIDDIIKKFIFL